MQVICVSAIDNPAAECVNSPRPEVGDRVTVLQQVKKGGHVFYILKEFLPDEGFLSSCFATLPDNTADEMAEEEQFIYDQFSC